MTCKGCGKSNKIPKAYSVQKDVAKCEACGFLTSKKEVRLFEIVVCSECLAKLKQIKKRQKIEF